MKRDKFYAKIAFYISLGFWIPLFNIGLSIAALILAVMAIKKHYNQPKQYGGLGYAIAAIVLSVSSIILTLVGLILFVTSDQICGSRMCESYLANN